MDSQNQEESNNRIWASQQ